jgi:hypothetical protein
MWRPRCWPTCPGGRQCSLLRLQHSSQSATRHAPVHRLPLACSALLLVSCASLQAGRSVQLAFRGWCALLGYAAPSLQGPTSAGLPHHQVHRRAKGPATTSSPAPLRRVVHWPVQRRQRSDRWEGAAAGLRLTCSPRTDVPSFPAPCLLAWAMTAVSFRAPRPPLRPAVHQRP